MISYNNDVHNPASRANQKDIAMRMQQFFDNKLKGSARAGLDGSRHSVRRQGQGSAGAACAGGEDHAVGWGDRLAFPLPATAFLSPAVFVSEPLFVPPSNRDGKPYG